MHISRTACTSLVSFCSLLIGPGMQSVTSADLPTFPGSAKPPVCDLRTMLGHPCSFLRWLMVPFGIFAYPQASLSGWKGKYTTSCVLLSWVFHFTCVWERWHMQTSSTLTWPTLRFQFFLLLQRVLSFGTIRMVHMVGAVLSQLSKGSFLLSREVFPQGLGPSLQFGVCLYIKP